MYCSLYYFSVNNLFILNKLNIFYEAKICNLQENDCIRKKAVARRSDASEDAPTALSHVPHQKKRAAVAEVVTL